MTHDHAHDHAHGHAQGHAQGHAHAHPQPSVHRPAPAEREAVAPSVLMSGAATRIGAVLVALVLLWGAVAWALTDLSA